jgi:uncharacterized membrane protein YcaP (DUF421 family)
MDLVLRAVVIFFFVMIVTRVAGRREIGQLEPFDMILLIVLGDLVQQGITQSDESVTGTMIVIATIAVLSVAVSWTSFRFPRVARITEGEPIVLVQDGRPLERNLRRERITLKDVQEQARASQIASIADLRWAILEDDGKISCIPRSS